MTIILGIRSRLGRVLLVLPTLLTVLTGQSCSIDKFPLPDKFDAALVTGEVCLPSNIATGTTEEDDAPLYPVRIETCVYRCVEVNRETVNWHYGWICQEPLGCQMVLLIMGEVNRVKGEKDCDARDLPDPPKSECKKEVFEFMIDPPCCLDPNGDDVNDYVAGDMVITVPYLTFEDGKEAGERFDAEESAFDIAMDVVGIQNYPERRFTFNFDPDNPVLTSPDELDSGDCHHIPAP